MSLTVACVLKSGGGFNASHVAALKKQVEQYVEHDRFVCLSDVEVPCGRIPLENNWPRWWPKLELFRRKQFSGPVLYFDLDTVLLAPFSVPLKVGEFWMLKDFFDYERRGRVTPASGIMAWWGNWTAIYESMKVRSSPPDANEWDQRHIAEFVKPKYLQDLGGIYSYKAHIKDKGLPPDARVVCFHGQPRPWDCGEEWIGDRYAD